MLLSELIGTWRGEGSGEYPTIEPFSYSEELVISDVGKPFLRYEQRTWSSLGAPMHTELGFLRAPNADQIEFVIAQPTGQTELLEGGLVALVSGFRLELGGRIMNTTTAKEVEATRREIQVQGDLLLYDFAMAAVGVPMTHHLHAELRRI